MTLVGNFIYIVKPSDYWAFFQAIKNLEMFWLSLAKLPS